MPKPAPARRVAAPEKLPGDRVKAKKYLYSTATDDLRAQTAGKTPKEAAEIRKRWLRSTSEGVEYKAALHQAKLAKHKALREFGLVTEKTIYVLKKPSKKKKTASAAAPAAPKQRIKKVPKAAPRVTGGLTPASWANGLV